MDEEDSVAAFHAEDAVLQRPVYRFATGRQALEEEGLGDRVDLRRADMTDLPAGMVEGIDLVSTVWRCITCRARTICAAAWRRSLVRAASGCAVWIG